MGWPMVHRYGVIVGKFVGPGSIWPPEFICKCSRPLAGGICWCGIRCWDPGHIAFPWQRWTHTSAQSPMFWRTRSFHCYLLHPESSSSIIFCRFLQFQDCLGPFCELAVHISFSVLVILFPFPGVQGDGIFINFLSLVLP